jgi:hypothetical protein
MSVADDLLDNQIDSIACRDLCGQCGFPVYEPPGCQCKDLLPLEMRNERNARLARAIGWVKFEGPQYQGRVWQCPIGSRQMRLNPPDFDADTPEGHYWKAKLLEWLAGDSERWKRFLYCLTDICPKPEVDEDWLMYGKVFLLASPAQVAEAADRAIGSTEEKK